MSLCSPLRNSKWCSVSSLTLIKYSSDKQSLRSDCPYAQADLRLCWSHIPHYGKSHVTAHIVVQPVTTQMHLLSLISAYWLSHTKHGSRWRFRALSTVYTIWLIKECDEYYFRRNCTSSPSVSHNLLLIWYILIHFSWIDLIIMIEIFGFGLKPQPCPWQKYLPIKQLADECPYMNLWPYFQSEVYHPGK